MHRLVSTLVLALVAALGIASGAGALEAKTALRAVSQSAEDPVGSFASQACEMRQQNPAFATKMASDSPYAPRAAATAAGFHKHHTVPREILKQLPADVAKHPAVRGRAGAPNRWSIPEDVHKAIHKGPGGGAYNEAFKQRLNDLGRRPTADDVVGIRDDLIRQFGLEGYRP